MVSEKVLIIDKLQVLTSSQALFPAVSMQLVAGQLITVMGPSGCGKSIFLGAIAGSLASDLKVRGDLYLQGKKLNNLQLHQREIAIAYQQDLLFPHMNVEGNLLFALPKGDSKQRQEVVQKALHSADLDGFGKSDISILSGGQKARVSILRSLLSQPKLLLLDEPFSKLDEQLRHDFRSFVYRQIKAMNIPAILVSHDKQDCNSAEFYALQSGKFMKRG